MNTWHIKIHMMEKFKSRHPSAKAKIKRHPN